MPTTTPANCPGDGGGTLTTQSEHMSPAKQVKFAPNVQVFSIVKMEDVSAEEYPKIMHPGRSAAPPSYGYPMTPERLDELYSQRPDLRKLPKFKLHQFWDDSKDQSACDLENAEKAAEAEKEAAAKVATAKAAAEKEAAAKKAAAEKAIVAENAAAAKKAAADAVIEQIMCGSVNCNCCASGCNGCSGCLRCIPCNVTNKRTPTSSSNLEPSCTCCLSACNGCPGCLQCIPCGTNVPCSRRHYKAHGKCFKTLNLSEQRNAAKAAEKIRFEKENTDTIMEKEAEKAALEHLQRSQEAEFARDQSQVKAILHKMEEASEYYKNEMKLQSDVNKWLQKEEIDYAKKEEIDCAKKREDEQRAKLAEKISIEEQVAVELHIIPLDIDGATKTLDVAKILKSCLDKSLPRFLERVADQLIQRNVLSLHDCSQSLTRATRIRIISRAVRVHGLYVAC